MTEGWWSLYLVNNKMKIDLLSIGLIDGTVIRDIRGLHAQERHYVVLARALITEPRKKIFYLSFLNNLVLCLSVQIPLLTVQYSYFSLTPDQD